MTSASPRTPNTVEIAVHAGPNKAPTSGKTERNVVGALLPFREPWSVNAPRLSGANEKPRCQQQEYNNLLGRTNKEGDMSRKETISNLFLQKREAPAPSSATKPDTDRVRSGAIGAMGASLKEMAESAKHAVDLQKQLEEANSILEIEPSHVEF